MSISPAIIDKTLKSEAIERVVIQGDLSRMSAEERVSYYRLVCESVGLNPLTKPFEYITLNGKLTLYARKDATDQLRSLHQVSVRIVGREVAEGCYVVTAQASFPSGRVDESIGAVPIENLKGEARANAMMKCETKAKRRVTLSACGLGMLDETEIETIPSARADVPRTTEPIPIPRNPAIEAAPDTSGKGLEKVADKPQEGQSSAGAPTPPLREPGSDDDLDELIDLPRQRALHRAFIDAIPAAASEETRKHGATIFREWLRNLGYIGEDKKGSTKMIPMVLYDEVKVAAVRYAGSLK